MALTAAFNGTNLTVADATTGFSNATITAAELWSEVKHQGDGCIGFQASSKDGYGAFTYGTAFNFNTTYLGQHIFMWVNYSTPGTLEAIATGGMYLIAGSDSSNYKKFLIAAKDYQEAIEKGFARWVFDPSKTATEDVGSPDMTAITFYGVWVDTDAASRADNLFIDRIDVGWGIEVTGTSTDFWADLAIEDIGLNAGVKEDMFGAVQYYQGVYFIYAQVKIGDESGTLSTEVSDSGKKIQFVSQQYYNGSSWVDLIADDFFKIEIVDNATGSTKFTDGVIVGTDNGRAGSSIAGSPLHGTSLECEGLTNSASFVKLYNTQLQGMRGGILLHSNANSLFYGGMVSKSGQIDPGIALLKNGTISETTSTDAALLWNVSINIQNFKFIANTAGAAIEHIAQATVNYDALFFSGNTYDILYSAAASSGLLTINAQNGADPSSYEIANTTGNTVSILNPKTKTFTGLPEDTEIRIRQGSFTLPNGYDADVSGGSFAFNYTPDNDKPARAQFTLPGYVFKPVEFLLDSTSQTIAVTVEPDPSYM